MQSSSTLLPGAVASVGEGGGAGAGGGGSGGDVGGGGGGEVSGGEYFMFTWEFGEFILFGRLVCQVPCSRVE